jgi:alcohol dehydrogenase class IV
MRSPARRWPTLARARRWACTTVSRSSSAAVRASLTGSRAGSRRTRCASTPTSLPRDAASVSAGDRTTPNAVALIERLGLPTRLRDCDVDEDDLDAVARMSQSSFAVQANLRPVGETDARAILDDAW